MSNYTTEVRFVCETLAGYDMSQGYGKVSEIIDKSWNKVFDFNFPIFDNSYKEALCKKILMHYYTREIGFETVGLWKLKLETKMNEIMPYYNKLYESETYKFNPLYDIDYTKTHEGEDSGTSEDSSSHTGTVGDSGTHGGTVGDSGTHGGSVTDSGTHGGTIGDTYTKKGNVDDTKHNENEDATWDVFSDTPQGALTNVENDTYLTNARKITKNGDEDGTNNRDYDEEGSSTRTFNETNGNTRTYNETNGNTKTYNETSGNTRTFNEGNDTDRSFSNTNEYVEHVMGKSSGASYSKMIMEYRESLLNIDMMVIKDLNQLFMLVW